MTTATRPAVGAIVAIYVAAFWIALPAGLWALGGWLDGLLGLEPLVGRGWLPAGAMTSAAGVAWMGWAMWVLWRRGEGWPISHLPPRRLVESGPYAFARHPIYIGFTLAFAGAGFAAQSLGRGVGAALVLALGATVYARAFEEPRLRRRYGAAYDAFAGPRLEWRHRVAALAGGYAVFCATYLPINAYSARRGVGHLLFLPGEAAIPFVPAMEYFYVLGYVIPLVAAIQIPDWARLTHYLRAFALTLAVAFATYLLYPVYFERPVLEVNSLATWLLSIEYLDHSYNHFPSLHVAIVWLGYFACRDRPACRGWLLPLTIAVSVSTVFVKQHYIVDVVYGATLAAAAWLATRWAPKST